ncbi:MAG: ABC transporter permease [Methylobacteriaceae bacterium]|nr:ABC transporter permease [Methylobacteriaceae bacterium]
MAQLIVKRLLQAVLTTFLVSLLIFAGTEILPGDVAIALLGSVATDEALHAIRVSLNLYDPAYVRYLRWLTGFLGGDLGTSLTTQAAIAPELWVRVINTFSLAGIAAVVVMPLSLLMGIITAVWRNGVVDRLVNILGLAAISLPVFLIAYILILVFSVHLGLFSSLSNVAANASFTERLDAIALPVITLVLAVFAYVMRMTRTAILSVMQESYIEMALLKGVPAWRIILYHALPNALAPIIQVISFNLAYMVAGVVIVEFIFVYPGVGSYLVEAVGKRDVPVVQACGLVFAVTYIVLNLLADLLNIVCNPRLRYPK